MRARFLYRSLRICIRIDHVHMYTHKLANSRTCKIAVSPVMSQHGNVPVLHLLKGRPLADPLWGMKANTPSFPIVVLFFPERWTELLFAASRMLLFLARHGETDQ